VCTNNKKIAKKYNEALFENRVHIDKNNRLKEDIEKVLKLNKDIHK
jgi:hypothetical protein